MLLLFTTLNYTLVLSTVCLGKCKGTVCSQVLTLCHFKWQKTKNWKTVQSQYVHKLSTGKNLSTVFVFCGECEDRLASGVGWRQAVTSFRESGLGSSLTSSSSYYTLTRHLLHKVIFRIVAKTEAQQKTWWLNTLMTVLFVMRSGRFDIKSGGVVNKCGEWGLKPNNLPGIHRTCCQKRWLSELWCAAHAWDGPLTVLWRGERGASRRGD